MTDTELLQASLTGNRTAYGQIVERYKSLICAIAYSITGDLSLSEDLAQETFVAAWRQLGGVRDVAKFRPWICAIARNLSRLALRKSRRDVMGHAQTLEAIPEPRATAPTPREYAVSQEEQALLWHAIEQIPEAYRVPLVLYYREGQSVQRVAQELGLSTDAVKQRLARGRHMLRDEIEVFVGRSLARTRPSGRFTPAVLSALPSGPLVGTAVGGLPGARLAQGLASAASTAGVKHVAASCLALVLLLGTAFAFLRGGPVVKARAAGPLESMPASLGSESLAAPAPEEAPPEEPPAETPTAHKSRDMPPPVAADAVPARAVAPAGYPGAPWPESPSDIIEGTVYDPAGGKSHEARVSAVRYGSGPIQVFECLSDARGQYRLRVPPGQWSVKARKGGLGGEAGPEIWGQVITEGRGDTITKPIRMEERGIIRGRILDKETGLPVRKGEIYALHQSGDTVVTGLDDEGRYELEGVAQYVHYLVALCPGYERRSVIANNVLRREAELEIHLARAGSISGVVIDAEGRPIAHAWVGWDVLNTGNCMYHYEVCDDQGCFTYDGLPAGRVVRLVAKYPCYDNVCAVDTGPEQEWEGVTPAAGGQTARAVISLRGEPVEELRSCWRGRYPAPEGAICGRVVTADGRPVRDFRILVQWPHSYHESGNHPDMSIDYWTRGFSFTAADGEFIVGVPGMRPGHVVRVAAAAEGYGQGVHDTVSVHEIGNMPSPGALVLRLGAPLGLIVRVVGSGSPASPLEGARVSVVDVPPNVGGIFQWNSAAMWRPVTLVTDARGYARFTGLEIAAGTVMAAKEGYGKGRIEWRNNERTLEVVLSGACVVEGTVLDNPGSERGRPVALGLVKLDRLPEGVYDSDDRAIDSFEATIRPEHRGTFRFEALPPGYYRLTAHWWRQPNQQNVSYADEFLLEPGDAITAVYPDDSVFNAPQRWLAEASDDPADEALRERLLGAWYHDVPGTNGAIQRTVYHFAGDGQSRRWLFYEGRPPVLTMPGYFKVYRGNLKAVEKERFPHDTAIAFADADTLLLGWMTSEPPLKRAANLEQVLREGQALLAGVRPASITLHANPPGWGADEAVGGGF